MCQICKRIELIEKNEEPYFIKKYETGYLSLFDNQAYPGYCLFIYVDHVEEIHEIPQEKRAQYFEELCEIVYKLDRHYKPRKINYCFLGNGCKHLHCHIIPNNEKERTIWHKDYREMFDYDINETVKKLRGIL